MKMTSSGVRCLARSLALGVAWFLSAAAQAGPLDTWHLRASGTEESLNGVAWGNGRFVAVGGGGIVVTSPDGAAWTPQAPLPVGQLIDVAYGNGLFVAISFGGNNMFTSPDGVAWTPRNVTIPGGFTAVIFTEGRFWLVGSGRTTGVSTNGLEWSGGKIPGTYQPACIAYGNGTAVVAGYRKSKTETGMLATSPDFKTWTPRESKMGDNIFGAGFGLGLFVIGDQDGNLATSPDGVEWTLRDSKTTGFIWDFAANPQHLVAASQWGRILHSDNGIDWVRAETEVSGHFKSIEFGNDTVVAVGWDGAIVQSEPLGESVSAPRLAIRQGQNQQITVSWPASAAGYVLESSYEADWGYIQESAPVTSNSTERSVTLAAAGNKFFRLKK